MRFATKEKAIAQIKDNSSIIFSGFQLSRAPISLVNEIVKQRKRDLEIISLPNPLPLDMLIKAGLVEKALFGFNGIMIEDGFHIMPNWKKAIEQHAIKYKETDVFEIISGLKAGINNKEYSEIDWIKNSDYPVYNRYEKKNNRYVTKAIMPDFAIIHAQRCDQEGNVEILDPLTDNLLWKSSKKVIVSVEEMVKKLNKITIPKEKIDSIIILPNGAWPTACFGFYNYSYDSIYHYLGSNGYDFNKKNINNLKFIKNINNNLKNNLINKKININNNSIINKKNKNINIGKLKNSDKKIIDYLICTLARQLKNNETVLTGVASPIPMLACLLAKSLKNINYINCSGAINTDPVEIPYSSENICFLDKKEEYIELAKIFESKIDAMFMGAVQINSLGDINMTCIGHFDRPKVKLPGPAATVYLRNKVKNPIVFVPKHSKMVFVHDVDFITSKTDKDTIVVTNLGILKLGKKPEIKGVSPFSSLKEIQVNTDFELGTKNAKVIEKPTIKELALLNRIDKKQIRYQLYSKEHK